MREIFVDEVLARQSGRFVRGISYSPKTQIRKGQHLSKGTEFIKGRHPHNKLSVGSVGIRKETHTGLLRAWVKIAEPNTWKKRAILVWESIHGQLLNGWVVHHKDNNSLNDDPKNLQGLTRKEHIECHRGELQNGNR